MKPVLFNTEMVRAILDGRKTTTRRVIKPQCKRNFIGTNFRKLPMECRMVDIETQEIIRPPISPFNPGDILYIRETWQYIDFAGENNGYVFKASENGMDWARNTEDWIWKPSLFMPKEAARIFLCVTDVKAERLQDIDKYWDNYDREGMRNPRTENISIAMQEKFISVWNSTVKKSDLDRFGWAANPWVWVISFERCEKPND